jgi:hypothetical protein
MGTMDRAMACLPAWIEAAVVGTTELSYKPEIVIFMYVRLVFSGRPIFLTDENALIFLSTTVL